MLRFELPKNQGGSCVNKGLSFFRRFVDSDSVESKIYFSQKAQLKSFPGEDFLALQGFYDELVAWASTYGKEWRGFLYSLQYVPGAPASVSDIALGIGTPEDRCVRYLKCLVKAQMIRWVYVPEPDGQGQPSIENSRPAEGMYVPEPDGQGQPSQRAYVPEPDGHGQPHAAGPDAGLEAKTAPLAEPRPSGGPPGGSGARPADPPGGSGAPPGDATVNELNELKQPNGPTVPKQETSKRSTDQRAERAEPPLAGQGGNGTNEPVPSKPPSGDGPVGQGQGPDIKAWQEEKQTELGARRLQGGGAEQPSNPESPSSPTKSEAGGWDQEGTAPSSPRDGLPDTDERHNKDIVAAHWALGARVFRALRMPYAVGSLHYREEVGSFASVLQIAKLDAEAVSKVIKHAAEIGNMKQYPDPHRRARIWVSCIKKRTSKGLRQRSAMG